MPPDIRKTSDLSVEYSDVMVRCQELYKKMIDCGMSLGTARYVLPSGFTTRIVMTMNARSLFNLIAQRECAAEEWEFRQLATLIHRQLIKVAPGIFRYAGTECETHAVCLEGEAGLDCGRLSKTGAVVENTREAILLMAGGGDASNSD
jgi:thymidylate synthase (FAD)